MNDIITTLSLNFRIEQMLLSQELSYGKNCIRAEIKPKDYDKFKWSDECYWVKGSKFPFFWKTLDPYQNLHNWPFWNKLYNTQNQYISPWTLWG
jgi:hypothetical protein